MVRKGEIACHKQFLLFSQCFPQLYSFSASKCGIVWERVNSSPEKLHTNSRYNVGSAPVFTIIVQSRFYHITTLVSDVIQPLRIFVSLTRVR